jgi:hypothetical protein
MNGGWTYDALAGRFLAKKNVDNSDDVLGIYKATRTSDASCLTLYSVGWHPNDTSNWKPEFDYVEDASALFTLTFPF